MCRRSPAWNMRLSATMSMPFLRRTICKIQWTLRSLEILRGWFRRNTKRRSLCCGYCLSWHTWGSPWQSSNENFCRLRRSYMRATERRTVTLPASGNTFLLTLIYQQKTPAGCLLQTPPSSTPPRLFPAKKHPSL